jgi:hypothetical protein
VLLVAAGLLRAQVGAADAPATGPASAAVAPDPGLLNAALRAQAPAWQQVDLGGQLRIREQARDGAGPFPNNDFVRNPGTKNKDNSDTCLLLRETGHIGYTPTSWLTLFAEGRNSTASGDNRSPNPDVNRLDLHQGYAQLGDLQAAPLQLKIGRQELAYGDQRWIGASDWSNVGRTFDAAKLRFGTDLSWVDAFVSHPVYVNDDHFDRWNQYEYLSGLYASSKELVPWQDTQLYFLSYNVEAEAPSISVPLTTGPSARDVYTFGTLCKSLPDALQGWDYSMELTLQLGTLTTNATQGERLDLKAYGAFLRAGYTWEQVWGKPRLGLGYTYGSGDDNAKDGKVGTLQDLFPTRHGRCGLMDLFSPRNMNIPRISAALEPVQTLKLTASYLMFWLADTNDGLYPESGAARNQNGYGIHPGFNSFVGSELDLVANYTARAWLNLQVGYGHFFVGDYIKETIATVPANGGTVAADWLYAQAIFNF